MTESKSLRSACDVVTEYHVGPIETGVDSGNVLYDECRACGYAWIIGELSPERAEAVRRALREGKPVPRP